MTFKKSFIYLNLILFSIIILSIINVDIEDIKLNGDTCKKKKLNIYCKINNLNKSKITLTYKASIPFTKLLYTKNLVFKKEIKLKLLFFSIKKYTLFTDTLTKLPYINIDTKNSFLEKKIKAKALISYFPSRNGKLKTINAKIRGHGNSSFYFKKKSYKIYLDIPHSFLNLPEDKEFILLANHVDRTLIRNSLANKIGELLNIKSLMKFKYIDLFINKIYQGNYQLFEKIELRNLKFEDKQNTLLLEIDNRLDKDKADIITLSKTHLHFKSKISKTNFNKKNIENLVNTLEKQLLINKNFKNVFKLLDLESTIKWFILTELTKNPDTHYFGSTYLLIKNNKIYFTTLWDFDLAFGNTSSLSKIQRNATNPTKFHTCNHNLWFKQLCKSDFFMKNVAKKWKGLDSLNLENLFNFINNYKNKLEKSQKFNHLKWNTLTTKMWPYPQLMGTYEGEISRLKSWLRRRYLWLDKEFKKKINELDTKKK